MRLYIKNIMRSTSAKIWKLDIMSHSEIDTQMKNSVNNAIVNDRLYNYGRPGSRSLELELELDRVSSVSVRFFVGGWEVAAVVIVRMAVAVAFLFLLYAWGPDR